MARNRYNVYGSRSDFLNFTEVILKLAQAALRKSEKNQNQIFYFSIGLTPPRESKNGKTILVFVLWQADFKRLKEIFSVNCNTN